MIKNGTGNVFEILNSLPIINITRYPIPSYFKHLYIFIFQNNIFLQNFKYLLMRVRAIALGI